MAFTVTINGTSWSDTDFSNKKYINNWDNFVSDLATMGSNLGNFNDLATSLSVAPASNDVFAIYDADAAAYKKIQYQYLSSGYDPTNNYAVITADGSNDMTDDDGFLYNDSAATTDHLQLLGASMTNAPTSAYYMKINDASLTTGGLAHFYSNSSDSGTRSLVEIENANSSANATECLRLTQAAAEPAIFIDQQSNAYGFQLDKTGGGSVEMAYFRSTSNTSANGVRMDCTSSSFSASVLLAYQSHASGSGDAITADVRGSGDHFVVAGSGSGNAFRIENTNTFDTSAPSGTSYYLDVDLNGTPAKILVQAVS